MQDVNHSCNTRKFSKCNYSLTCVLNVDAICFTILISWTYLSFILNFTNTVYFAIDYRFHRTFFRSQSIVRSFLALHPATPCCLVEPKDLLSKMRPSNTSCKWFSSKWCKVKYEIVTYLYCMRKETKCFVPLQWINWYLFYAKDNRGFR